MDQDDVKELAQLSVGTRRTVRPPSVSPVVYLSVAFVLLIGIVMGVLGTSAYRSLAMRLDEANARIAKAEEKSAAARASFEALRVEQERTLQQLQGQTQQLQKETLPTIDQALRQMRREMSERASFEDARSLFWNALDAEARGDHPTAIKMYESLKRLPANLWPPDLDRRLQDARTSQEQTVPSRPEEPKLFVPPPDQRPVTSTNASAAISGTQQTDQLTAQPTNLQNAMASIVQSANVLMRQSTVGLTTAQLNDLRQRRQGELLRLESSFTNNRFSMTLTIKDVVPDKAGGYVATGEFALPVPDEVQQKWRDELRAINQKYDGDVAQQKSSHIELGKSESVARLELSRKDALRNAQARHQAPRATVHVSGDARLLEWGRGRTVRIESCTVSQVQLHAPDPVTSSRSGANVGPWSGMPRGWTAVTSADVFVTIQ